MVISKCLYPWWKFKTANYWPISLRSSIPQNIDVSMRYLWKRAISLSVSTRTRSRVVLLLSCPSPRLPFDTLLCNKSWFCPKNMIFQFNQKPSQFVKLFRCKLFQNYDLLQRRVSKGRRGEGQDSNTTTRDRVRVHTGERDSSLP